MKVRLLATSLMLILGVLPAPGQSPDGQSPDGQSPDGESVPISERGHLGLVVGPAEAERGSAFSKVKVLHVYEDGAAEASGLVEGDVISELNGIGFEFPSIDAFHESLSWIKPGDTIVLTVHRDGGTRRVELVAREQPPEVKRQNLEREVARAADRALLKLGPEDRLRITKVGEGRELEVSTTGDLSDEEVQAVQTYLRRLSKSPAYRLMGEGDWAEFEVVPKRRGRITYPSLNVVETSGLWAEILMKVAPKSSR